MENERNFASTRNSKRILLLEYYFKWAIGNLGLLQCTRLNGLLVGDFFFSSLVLHLKMKYPRCKYTHLLTHTHSKSRVVFCISYEWIAQFCYCYYYFITCFFSALAGFSFISFFLIFTGNMVFSSFSYVFHGFFHIYLDGSVFFFLLLCLENVVCVFLFHHKRTFYTFAFSIRLKDKIKGIYCFHIYSIYTAFERSRMRSCEKQFVCEHAHALVHRKYIYMSPIWLKSININVLSDSHINTFWMWDN